MYPLIRLLKIKIKSYNINTKRVNKRSEMTIFSQILYSKYLRYQYI